MRFFNVAGPCQADRHYRIPPEPRLPEARELIDEGQFFVVRAPRQTGKTTTLASLARTLTAEGEYAALWFSCEMDQAVERLIVARATHLDSLAARLHEPRVKRIVEPLIAGATLGTDSSYNDDVAYLRDLGLIARTKQVQIANPIYQEVILRCSVSTPRVTSIWTRTRS